MTTNICPECGSYETLQAGNYHAECLDCGWFGLSRKLKSPGDLIDAAELKMEER